VGVGNKEVLLVGTEDDSGISGIVESGLDGGGGTEGVTLRVKLGDKGVDELLLDGRSWQSVDGQCLGVGVEE